MNDRLVTTLPRIEDILPHRGSMLLLSHVDTWDETTLRASARVDPTAWYADPEGAMPAWFGIELMAQAIAAHVGLLSMRDGNPARPGVLLGSRKYEAHTPAFAPDPPLSIAVQEVLRSTEGHGAYACTIAAGGRDLAQAVIKVYQPTDFQAFIEGSFAS
ncbi:beta-hydroxyacyl-ACP dehydratase [Ralstonia solanacearum]|uniref:Beta-hydroxyacyl-ACP dehydratase n=1 Tax=Ralstonia solanacearum K60 TaxID=1091042 RepID=A0AAP7ZIG6_RALSL|nr:beta-hydroxyacyl-ACP dehydratase [Ralstonia solanacearum]MBT1539431.1 beta-hydroxyacyl-ACP dehydratase [Ralstonia solanacearum]OYQ09186.1 beta-hydroxyacyl-ACP dehydratase [Ralstonia solanacearum K60]QOK84357.1 beta-hydroxyacyl-ACP dehydratase [Ralstonia solanacearum]RIJ84792.1 beta-hydroxyacyl-ACP dehydratase [Ralstonia solanacearum]